jgi:hypothetical protein
MLGYHMPECIDIAHAKERASLSILIVALHAVEQALYVEHPLLIQQNPPQSGPPTVRLAAKIIDRCSTLQRLIEIYDQAIQDAIESDSYMDEHIF